MEIPPGYTIERISKDRLKDLVYLHENCYGRRLPLKHFRQKFNTRVPGCNWLGYVAYDLKGKPAAYYGAYATKSVLQQQVFLAAVSGDTMTHTAHRGKGLFLSLAQKTFELAKQAGIVYMYGFPNEHSYPGFVKLGWHFRPETMKLYRFKIAVIPLLSIAKRLRLLSLYNLYTKAILSFYKAGQFPNASLAGHEGKNGILHDATFLKYKTARGARLVCLGKSVVLLKTGAVLKIGEVLNLEESELHVFLKHLEKLAQAMGCREIHWEMEENSKYDEMLSFGYEGIKTFKIGEFSLNKDFPVGQLHFTAADIDTF